MNLKFCCLFKFFSSANIFGNHCNMKNVIEMTTIYEKQLAIIYYILYVT